MTGYEPGTSSGPPPGWYGDPGGAPTLRWWDGSRWTEHTQPAPEPRSAVPPQPAQPPGMAANAEPAPDPQEARAEAPARRHSKAASMALGLALVLGIIFFIGVAVANNGSTGSGSPAAGPPSASAAASSAPCTTASCIITDAKQALVGGVAKDESVMTALSCRKFTVKNPDPGVWTVQCTATYSDASVYAGIASVLLSQNKATWEPTNVINDGNGD